MAGFAVNEDHIPVQDKERVLDLLAEQVKIASDILEISNQLLLTDKKNSVCPVAQYDENIKKIKEDISSILEIEQEIRSEWITEKRY